MRLVAVVAIFATGMVMSGCSVGAGDACNPLLSHDECSSGLECVTPTNCANAYCCPTDNASLAMSLLQCQACAASVDASTPPASGTDAEAGQD